MTTDDDHTELVEQALCQEDEQRCSQDHPLPPCQRRSSSSDGSVSDGGSGDESDDDDDDDRFQSEPTAVAENSQETPTPAPPITRLIWTDRDDPKEMLEQMQPSLTRLSLRNLCFTDAWTRATRDLASLTDLELTDCRGVAGVLRGLPRLTLRRVTERSVWDALPTGLPELRVECRLDAVAARSIGRARAENLNLHRSSFADEDAVRALAEGLREGVPDELDLSNCRLTDRHLATLLAAMPRLPAKKLILDGNECRSDGLQELSKLLSRSPQSNAELSLAHQIKSSSSDRLDLAILFPALRLHGCRSLNLSRNRLTGDDDALLPLWQHVLTSPRCRLRYLDISHNPFSSRTLSEVARCMPDWPTLRGLRVDARGSTLDDIVGVLRRADNAVLTDCHVNGDALVARWASLNRGGGRKLLRSDRPVPAGMWARVLSEQSPDVTYHVVCRAIPGLLAGIEQKE